METGDKNTGLYVHIPFCLQKCPYCDFLSFDDNLFYADDYINALSAELEYYKKNYDPVYETLFIGGGTPTCLSEKQLDYLFASVYRYAEKNKLKEITIEMNPETLTEKKARVLKINANRVSVGAQSFNNKFLKELGRVHDSEAVLKTADILKQNKMDNFNIDLMFGIPGQTVTDVIYDIKAAAKLNPSHISFYMLTLYEGTPYAESANLPQDNILAQMYEKGTETLEAAGYKQYEISNFAKPGKKCLHNLNYWGTGRYIGIGTSASSYFDGKRYKNISNVAEYINRMKKNNDPAETCEETTKEHRVKEYIMLCLRKNEGINAAEFKDNFNFEFAQKYSNIIGKLKDEGMLKEKDGRVFLTTRGMLVSNRVISEFF